MNTKKAVVLGCGMMGATMARELVRGGGFDVTAADLSAESLQKVDGRDGVQARQCDLSDPKQIQRLVEPFDIVLGALPSRFGFRALESVLSACKPYCDISFMAEDALALDELAKANGVTAIVDCGVSPGLSNMMVGDAFAKLERAERAVIYVGGLPKVRRWPFEYRAPFAPADVIEEYTRPARMVENGRMVVKPALSERELVQLSTVGTLEAFNTDGLRSLLRTMKIRDMKEKTFRYPGHAELMRVFRETGLFEKTQISVGEAKVCPLDVTSKLLFPHWKLSEGEVEFTVLRVCVEGIRSGKALRMMYDLYDEHDVQRGESSMARTTTFPNVIAARMLMEGRFAQTGVFPPELIVQKEGIFEYFLRELERRGVRVTTTQEEII